MTSRNSCSKGLLRDGMRRNLWAVVLSGLGFFLSLMLPVLMAMQRGLEEKQMYMMTSYVDPAWEERWNNVLRGIASLLGGQNPMIKIVFLVLAIVCGVSAFAYLHSRQKVDFYHSLPISRTKLYWNNFCASLLCTLPVYFIMLALTLTCVYAMGFGEAVSWAALGSAVLGHLVIFLTVYALTVLTTVLCGNTVITLLLLLWVMFSPALAYLMAIGLCQKFFDTFFVSGSMYTKALKLSPLMEYFDLDGVMYSGYSGITGFGIDGSASGLLAVYLLLGVLAALLGWRLFRVRKSERAGAALAFEPAKLPVKVYICLVMGAAFGMVFNLISSDFWFWPGLVLGVIIFHAVVEIIYAFDFRAIFKHPAHMLAVLAVLIAGVLCLKFDVTGYDRWLPDESSIEAVGLNQYYDGPNLTSAENIKAVRRLAELGIQMTEASGEHGTGNLRELFGEYRMGTSLTVKYRLANGRTAGRQYTLYLNKEAEALLGQVKTSEEYIRAEWPLFQYAETADEDSAPFIEVYTNALGYDTAVAIGDADQVRQIIQTLREETLARTETGAPVLRLGLCARTQRDRRDDRWYTGNAYVTAADTKTLALIKQFAGVEPAGIDADAVSCVTVHYDGETGSETVEVTDRADIEGFLQNAINRDTMEVYYSSFGPQDGCCAIAEDDGWSVWVVSADNNESFGLAYPVGKTPDALLDQYRPAGIEPAQTMGVQTYPGGVTTEAVIVN